MAINAPNRRVDLAVEKHGGELLLWTGEVTFVSTHGNGQDAPKPPFMRLRSDSLVRQSRVGSGACAVHRTANPGVAIFIGRKLRPDRGMAMEFVFGEHRLDVDRRELRRCGEPIALQPQVFDLLVFLLCNCELVVSKADLLTEIWRGRVVSDSTLASRINAARKAIGDDGGAQSLIRTVPRKGVRFVGLVREETIAQSPNPLRRRRRPSQTNPRSRCCPSQT